MSPAGIITDQTQKTPISDGPNSAPFRFRYGFDRSADSINANQTGQDCLTIEWDGNRLVAVLCDGVSQSFFGDLSAKFLSENLSGFLIDRSLILDSDQFFSQTIGFLNQLSIEFSQTIENYSLENITPEFLRAVLERKRHLGSEAVFSAMVLDKSRAIAALLWAGDSRIRIWNKRIEVTREHLLFEEFLTQERWSSHKGLVGDLHFKFLSPYDFDELVLYSDGLEIADKETNLFSMDNVQIERLINRTKNTAGSDDITFFQMTSRLQPQWQSGSTNVKNNLRFEPDLESERLKIEWSGTRSQNLWELAVASERGFSVLNIEQPAVKMLLSEIPRAGAFFAVRNVSPQNLSAWSEWFFFRPPSLNSALPIKDDRSEVVKKTADYVSTKAVSFLDGENGHYQPPDPIKIDYKYPEYLPPKPPDLTSNRRWQLVLVLLILVTLCLGSLLFIFRKDAPSPPEPSQRPPTIQPTVTLEQWEQIEPLPTDEAVLETPSPYPSVTPTQTDPTPTNPGIDEALIPEEPSSPKLFFGSGDGRLSCIISGAFQGGNIPNTYFIYAKSRQICSYPE